MFEQKTTHFLSFLKRGPGKHNYVIGPGSPGVPNSHYGAILCFLEFSVKGPQQQKTPQKHFWERFLGIFRQAQGGLWVGQGDLWGGQGA